jgi:hypothetical protein
LENHILIEFPVFSGALAGEPISKPRSAVSSHGGRVRNVAQQTKLPRRKTPSNKNLGQLVGAAKAVLDYYGPVLDELSVQAKERDLFHRLENALAPFLREAAARGGPLTRQPKPQRAKVHVMPKPKPGHPSSHCHESCLISVKSIHRMKTSRLAARISRAWADLMLRAKHSCVITTRDAATIRML